MALSSCEVEYIAATSATSATCQVIWPNRLISELKGVEERPMKLLVDNQSAITVRKNPFHHNLTKHIDTCYHFIRQCVKEKMIEVA